jgi:Zn-dependent protease with chaperone function
LIAGRYFDGKSSAPLEATLEFGADGTVRVHGLTQRVAAPLADITISDRVGNIVRRISFADGGVFETADNDAVDRARDAAGLGRGMGVVHWLESRWQIALGSLAAVALISFAFIQWGVPAIANWAAQVLPPAMDSAIGEGSLDVLDRVAFAPSKLSDPRQHQLEARFNAMTAPLNDGHQYQLALRDGGRGIGANAFALPSGIVVMTDQLVDASKSDDELVAVLAHEIGHVRGRHALRQLLNAAGVTAMAAALLGDVSSISGVLASAPALIQARNSREFETEADNFSRQWLRTHGIAESNFDAILCRIAGGDKDPGTFDFMSSHPATSQRAHCPDDSKPKSGSGPARVRR